MQNKENRKRVKKLWQDEHIEQCRKYRRDWRNRNIKHCREYDKKYEENRGDRLEYFKKYYKDNKEKMNEKYDQWNKEHLAHRKEYHKRYDNQYLILNRERIYAHHRQWTKTEKGKMVKQRGNIARRVRNNNIINNLTLQEWLDILEEYNYRCAYCGCEFDEDTLPTKDHVIPISKGGHNTKENVVPACQSCNSRKNNKIISEVKGG